MRWALVLLVGCRQILGIDAPEHGADAAISVDAFEFQDAPCTDGDHDGICDAVDDWPCGDKPDPPAASVTDSANGTLSVLTVTNAEVDTSGGRFLVTSAGANVPLQITYSITDTACNNNCLDQVEVGFLHRSACVFDGQVSKSLGVTATSSVVLVAPAGAGTIPVRVHFAQNISCNAGGNTDWFGSTPTPMQTIAYVCVP